MLFQVVLAPQENIGGKIVEIDRKYASVKGNKQTRLQGALEKHRYKALLVALQK